MKAVYGHLVKMHVGKALDNWLLDANHVGLWESNMLTVSQRIMFVTHWVGEAAEPIDVEIWRLSRLEARIREDRPGDNRRRKR